MKTRSREPSPVRDAGGNVIDISKDRYGDNLKQASKKVKVNEDATKDATKSVASQLKDNG
jgi:predicted metal-binding transcription factor (methanogenesis marker protein 9)